ncbi:MAG: transcription termination/antitermination protein NusG [Clostridia bacterium]
MENIDQAKWYVVHTYTGHEKMVEDNLKKMIENSNLHELILDIAIPVEEDIVEKNGKRKVVERKKFPGYVFVKMVETAHVCFMVSSTRGVTNFVGPCGKPTALHSEEVKRMGLEKIDIIDFDIKTGDNIRVINGALESFIGVVDGINLERQKVKVIVSMFGRQTPVELDITQIEKIQL